MLTIRAIIRSSYPKFLLVIILFLISSNFSTAQKVVFQNKNGSRHRAYSLPIKVKCIFKDGRKQALVLEKVSGDSLYFHQVDFDCRVYDIKRIRINRSLNIVSDLIVLGGVGCTLYLAGFIAYYITEPYVVFAIPIVGVIGLGTYIFGRTTDNKFKLKNYYVKAY